jgi:hypothetical protein
MFGRQPLGTVELLRVGLGSSCIDVLVGQLLCYHVRISLSFVHVSNGQELVVELAI